MEVFKLNNIINVEEELNDKFDLFKLIAQSAYEFELVDKFEDAYEALCEREATGSTGFVDGFAIPHGKSDLIKKPCIFIFRTKPINWEGMMDDSKVTTAISLMIPKQGSDEHLRYLSKIAKLLTHKEYQEVLKTGTNEEIYTITLNGIA